MPEYTPQDLATKRRKLALEYKEKMKELGEIKKRRAFEILRLLAEWGSMPKADAHYATTPDGQKMIELEFYCRGLLETMRAVKTEVDIMQSEAFNQY